MEHWYGYMYRYRYVTPVSFYRNVDPSLVETNLDGIPAN